MRVVLVGPFAFYPKGTVPLRMLPLAKELQKKGHQVVILLPPYDNLADSGRGFTVEGVSVVNVVVPKTFLPMKYFYVAWGLMKKALAFQPDVVHVFKPKGFSGLAGMFLILCKFLRLTRVPVVIDSDDWEGYGGFADFFLEHGVHPKAMVDFFDFQEKWLITHAGAVTVASKALELRARDLRERGRDGVFYVPNGATELPTSVSSSTSEFRKSLGLEGYRIILLYTRFFEYDVEEVLEILTLVVSKSTHVRLLVVGKGEFREERKLLRLAKERRLLDYIVYIGWVEPQEVRSFIEISDVAIYPFRDSQLNRAKCPGKVVQLMSLGRTIVADDVGQIAEYIENGKSGILTKSGDVTDFAGGIVRLLEDDTLRERLGENAKKRIWASFRWEKLGEGVEEAYRFVLKREV